MICHSAISMLNEHSTTINGVNELLLGDLAAITKLDDQFFAVVGARIDLAFLVDF